MIPEYELNVMLLAEVEAGDLASEGSVVAGYHCLAAGLRRADEARQAGEENGDELVRQWQKAVDSYCRRYGARLL